MEHQLKYYFHTCGRFQKKSGTVKRISFFFRMSADDIEPEDEIERMLWQAEKEVAELSKEVQTQKYKYQNSVKQQEKWEAYAHQLRLLIKIRPKRKRYEEMNEHTLQENNEGDFQATQISKI